MPAPTSPEISIERLEKGHDRSSFSCGVDALDRYLATQASQDARRRVAATYVCVERGGKRVAGYYTLSATSIALSGLPRDIAKKLPKYPDVPAALIGRLAVDRNHHGQGLGAVLLVDALERAVETAERIGVYAVVVDAKDDAAIAFYEKHGFISLRDMERRLFLPMETARNAWQRPGGASRSSMNRRASASAAARVPDLTPRPVHGATRARPRRATH